jgi:hypothetical protein
MTKRFGIAAALLIAMTGISHAKTQHTDWVTDKKSDGRCIAFSSPTSNDGAITGRNGPYITVMNSPKEGIRGAISFVSGSQLTGMGEVKVAVDGEAFEVLPFKDAAFAASGKPEAAVLAAMRKGQFLTINWNTNDGQSVIDTYSLAGFSAAHSAIENCR